MLGLSSRQIVRIEYSSMGKQAFWLLLTTMGGNFPHYFVAVGKLYTQAGDNMLFDGFWPL